MIYVYCLQLDISETFLQAIRSGNLGNFVELLNNATLDIDASNQVSLPFYIISWLAGANNANADNW